MSDQTFYFTGDGASCSGAPSRLRSGAPGYSFEFTNTSGANFDRDEVEKIRAALSAWLDEAAPTTLAPTFTAGDKVRVSDSPVWNLSGEESSSIVSKHAGRIGTIGSGLMGKNVLVVFDNDDAYFLPSCLTKVEEPAPITFAKGDSVRVLTERGRYGHAFAKGQIVTVVDDGGDRVVLSGDNTRLAGPRRIHQTLPREEVELVLDAPEPTFQVGDRGTHEIYKALPVGSQVHYAFAGEWEKGEDGLWSVNNGKPYRGLSFDTLAEGRPIIRIGKPAPAEPEPVYVGAEDIPVVGRDALIHEGDYGAHQGLWRVRDINPADFNIVPAPPAPSFAAGDRVAIADGVTRSRVGSVLTPGEIGTIDSIAETKDHAGVRLDRGRYVSMNLTDLEPASAEPEPDYGSMVFVKIKDFHETGENLKHAGDRCRQLQTEGFCEVDVDPDDFHLIPKPEPKFSVGDRVVVTDYDDEDDEAVKVNGKTGEVTGSDSLYVDVRLDEETDGLTDWLFTEDEIELAQPEEPAPELPRREVGSKAVATGTSSGWVADWHPALDDGTVVSISEGLEYDERGNTYGIEWIDENDERQERYIDARDLRDYEEPEPRVFEPGDRVQTICETKGFSGPSIPAGSLGTVTRGLLSGARCPDRVFVDVDGMTQRYLLKEDIAHWTEPEPSPRPIQVGDRVIAVRDSASFFGDPYRKGTLATVNHDYEDGTVGVRRDDGAGANVPPVRDLVAFEPLTDPKPGDRVVVLRDGFSIYGRPVSAGDVGSIEDWKVWSWRGDAVRVVLDGADEFDDGARYIYPANLGRVLS